MLHSKLYMSRCTTLAFKTFKTLSANATNRIRLFRSAVEQGSDGGIMIAYVKGICAISTLLLHDDWRRIFRQLRTCELTPVV